MKPYHLACAKMPVQWESFVACIVECSVARVGVRVEVEIAI